MHIKKRVTNQRRRTKSNQTAPPPHVLFPLRKSAQRTRSAKTTSTCPEKSRPGDNLRKTTHCLHICICACSPLLHQQNPTLTERKMICLESCARASARPIVGATGARIVPAVRPGRRARRRCPRGTPRGRRARASPAGRTPSATPPPRSRPSGSTLWAAGATAPPVTEAETKAGQS